MIAAVQLQARLPDVSGSGREQKPLKFAPHARIGGEIARGPDQQCQRGEALLAVDNFETASGVRIEDDVAEEQIGLAAGSARYASKISA